ncbi:elongation factor P hydroxylase [Congregibacter sp.]|uniref:elongation factor P hydroxylase n=1 Tax=Congregibacter sp. TaxID=2744308 RepID=UPI003F6A8778
MSSSRGLNADQLIEIFNDLFLQSNRTRLQGGAVEPLYEPAQGDAPARISFRADYASSALHEVAHWCIAGEARRKQLDYGYWYDPDGRSVAAQARFLEAEARPQALEWCLSRAGRIPFRLSLDNLDAPTDPAVTRAFGAAVLSEARAFSHHGLPLRADQFFTALRAHSGARETLKDLEFNEVNLL